MFRLPSFVPNSFASRPQPPAESPESPEAPESPAMAEETPKPFPFMRLPLELREQIYSIYFNPADHLVKNVDLEARGFFGGIYKWDFDIWTVSKQIHAESKKVWKRENVFVKIATPWPSAGMYRVYIMATEGAPEALAQSPADRLNHISSEGLVPIVCTESRANEFSSHYAVVQITAPFHGVVAEHMVVMLVDDLHLFAQTWYYSALSYPMLNERLSTMFILRNPNREVDSDEQDIGVPLSIQRRLLYPFEHVKGLHGTEFQNYDPTIQAELSRLQAKPIPTLQEALESATDYMEAGDVALTAPNTDTETSALQALDLYRKAFHAIHILIHNRTRRVMADMFFHDSVAKGRYAGQTGITIRVILRLKLVSRTVAAYNKLGRWDDAAFWGMRSIRILRETSNPDFEAFLTEVLGGMDIALLYVRTGIAFWKMEQQQENWWGEMIAYADEELAKSVELWVAAGNYMKSQARGHVRKELEGYGVPREIFEELFSDVERAEGRESVMAEDGSSSSEG
ncbi:hypothetical protein PTNB85_04202 [Pyrenophora teres f. teres]|nr:hypothetical protein PTNB85_04202 [Pyrenophora teres f. teres]